jgi:hypothetical protein
MAKNGSNSKNISINTFPVPKKGISGGSRTRNPKNCAQIWKLLFYVVIFGAL